MDHGVAFRPLEVAVRAEAGGVTQMEQDRGERVGNDWAVDAQHVVPVDVDAADREDVGE